jgi:Ca2+-binding EF-hand superfamily protein
MMIGAAEGATPMLSPFRTRKFTTLFELTDRNKDGRIDLADFTHYAQGIREERGWAADSPAVSGLVDGSTQWWREMVQHVGGDDKSISLAEFLAFWDHLGRELAKGAVPPWALDTCARIHQALDTSGNGTVNEREYGVWLRSAGSTADPKTVFAKLDTNGDGVVTLSEMMTLFAQFVLSDNPADPGNLLMTGTLD